MLIPDPLAIRVAPVPLMDLGSVINDCGYKHYNLGRDFGAEMGLYNCT